MFGALVPQICCPGSRSFLRSVSARTNGCGIVYNYTVAQISKNTSHEGVDTTPESPWPGTRTVMLI